MRVGTGSVRERHWGKGSIWSAVPVPCLSGLRESRAAGQQLQRGQSPVEHRESVHPSAQDVGLRDMDQANEGRDLCHGDMAQELENRDLDLIGQDLGL